MSIEAFPNTNIAGKVDVLKVSNQELQIKRNNDFKAEAICLKIYKMEDIQNHPSREKMCPFTKLRKLRKIETIVQ